MENGQIVDQVIGVVKYEPPEENMPQARGQVERDPEGWTFHKYTDIEALRRYKDCLLDGEEVVLTEKSMARTLGFVGMEIVSGAGLKTKSKKKT